MGSGTRTQVVLFVIDLDAAQHFDAVVDRGLLDLDGLEAALERGVFLDILAVFAEGSCADDLHLPAGQRRFHDVSGVHRAVGIARADEVVDLVDEQNHIARRLDLAEQALDALLELAAELGPGDKGGEVKQIDLLILQAGGHLTFGNALGDALGDGGLADAGFADQAGVVFLAAAEDLQRAVNFTVAADNAVDAAVFGLLGQVFTVGVQELAARGLVLFAGLFPVGVLGVGAQAERERRAAAGDEFLLAFGVGGHHRAGLTGFLQEAGHALLHVFEVLVAHAETLHQVVDRFDVQFAGAGQAVPFLNGFAVLKALYKDHCGTFFAAGTKHTEIHLFH